jgi:hypothetical protein
MEARQAARQEEKQKLLQRLVEIEIEELREKGVFDSTPHYSTLEQAASDLGREVSRQAQQRAACEVRADAPETVACPTCGRDCPVTTKRRVVRSVDGPVKLHEAAAHCPTCRRSFFPSAGGLGAGCPQRHPRADAGHR